MLFVLFILVYCLCLVCLNYASLSLSLPLPPAFSPLFFFHSMFQLLSLCYFSSSLPYFRLLLSCYYRYSFYLFKFYFSFVLYLSTFLPPPPFLILFDFVMHRLTNHIVSPFSVSCYLFVFRPVSPSYVLSSMHANIIHDFL